MKETLSFQIVLLYRDFLAYTTKKLKSIGLTFGQMPLVVYTGKHPGCTQAELKKNLKLDWGYSQRSVKKLAETGFLVKTYSEEQSCNCLHLTENGKKAFDVCHTVFDSWDRIKMEEFSDEEKKSIVRLLEKLTV